MWGQFCTLTPLPLCKIFRQNCISLQILLSKLSIFLQSSKRNKWEATVDALQVRHLTSENCERDKRKYTKSTNEYWSDTIFKQRAAEKANISEEMLLVADKYSEIDQVPCSIDDLSVTEIRDELRKK
jgi:hypothetical protein